MMTTIFLLFHLLSFPQWSWQRGRDVGGRVYDRIVTVGVDEFRVRYYIHEDAMVVIPAVSEAQPHYPARIEVWNKGKLIHQLEGQWTENGCFEDNPIRIVKKAIGE